MNEVRTVLVHSIVAQFQALFGCAPFGPPRVEVWPTLDCDGLSEPGLIRLHPRLGRTDRGHFLLTLAHEVAHQWWGANGRRHALPNEAMAELMAHRWLRAVGYEDEARHQLRIARGKMLHGFLAGGALREEAEIMGRQFLVLHDVARLEGRAFWRQAAAVLAGDPTGAALIDAVLPTLSQPYALPVPEVVEGRVRDRDETGLVCAVDLRSRTGAALVRWIGGRLPRGATLAARQDGCCFSADLVEDAATYRAALGLQCM